VPKRRRLARLEVFDPALDLVLAGLARLGRAHVELSPTRSLPGSTYSDATLVCAPRRLKRRSKRILAS
jgi:hypothetical protein